MKKKRGKKGIRAVFGIFETRLELDAAVEILRARGFRFSDVSVLVPSSCGSQEFAHKRKSCISEGIAAGSASGLTLGGTLGWLVGTGAFAVPGIGPLIASGPIISAIAGAGIGGAMGSLSGALVGMGFTKYVALRYNEYVQRGGILISIHVDNRAWETKAKALLKSCGARDIAAVQEKKSTPLPTVLEGQTEKSNHRASELTSWRAAGF